MMEASAFPRQWNRNEILTFEPRRQKNGLRGFRPGPTQIRLRRLRKWLEARNFVFRKGRDCTIRVAKTKALISFAVTAKLICVFVFAYAKIRFSYVAAHLLQFYGKTVVYQPCREDENRTNEPRREKTELLHLREQVVR